MVNINLQIDLSKKFRWLLYVYVVKKMCCCRPIVRDLVDEIIVIKEGEIV